MKMKRSNLAKVLGASALALSMAIAPSVKPANAQDLGAEEPVGGVEVVEDEGVDFDDWGWLGLLGLIGLFGLAGGNRHRHDDTVRYREPDVTTRTGYRE